MTRNLLLWSVAVVAIAGMVAWGSISAATTTAISSSELEAYRGGYEQVCVIAVLDPDALDCNECAPNGNEGSVHCTSAGQNAKPHYVSGQNPAQRWDFTLTNCDGQARFYDDPDCDGELLFESNCNRQYQKATYLGTVPINCP